MIKLCLTQCSRQYSAALRTAAAQPVLAQGQLSREQEGGVGRSVLWNVPVSFSRKNVGLEKRQARLQTRSQSAGQVQKETKW